MEIDSMEVATSVGVQMAGPLVGDSSDSSFIVPRSSYPSPLPLPERGVVIRPGVLSDVPFLDSLQKLHTKQVGWMPRAQFEGKIAAGHVLIAERRETGDVRREEEDDPSALTPDVSRLTSLPPSPVGYCIGNDQYFKRDDVGIIYQMNVLPGRQRGLVGAMLLKAMFERSAYGCKLFCCWCAQDIEANRFWEAMGFVPLAFRTGGEKRGPKGAARTHIFWQKRIREGDTQTPWWFPSQTTGGSMRSDRIVLPIPPGTHWSDAKPIVLPGMPMLGVAARQVGESAIRGLPDDSTALASTRRLADSPKLKRTRKAKAAVTTTPPAPVRPAEVPSGGFWFAPVTPATPVIEPLPAVATVTEAVVKVPRTKPKNDPRLVAAARELRDRWLEQVNATPLIGHERYAVSKSLALPFNRSARLAA